MSIRSIQYNSLNSKRFSQRKITGYLPREPRTITNVGTPEVSTTQVKFGTGSLTGNTADTDKLHITPNWLNANDDFTCECWFYSTAVGTYQELLRGSHTNRTFAIIVTSNSLYFYLANINSSWNLVNGAIAASVSSNTWYHFALTKQGSIFRIYLNGTLRYTYNTGSNMQNPASTSDPIRLGGILGYIDEFRVSYNVRYTANFTPDTSAFVNDGATGVLLHMDGTAGSTTFTDDAVY